MKFNCRVLLGLMTVGLVASCGKKADDSTIASTQPASVAELKLSSALKVDIPDGLETAAGGTSGTGLQLTANKKSSEACRVMENTNRVFENLKQIGGMFCHLEVESAQMKFGTKYNVSITGDSGLTDESMSIWVDNSDASSLKVYMCEAGALKETFTISSFGGEEGLVKGSLSSKHSESRDGETSSGGINMEFDFTTKGVKILSAKMKHTQVGGQFAGSFRNASDISIIDDGLSSIKMSNAGTRGSDTMSDQGAVLFNGTTGQALFTGAGSYQSNSYDWTTRSTFDKDGYIQTSTSATADVIVDKASLPEKLAESFAPTEPSGWDCSGATETVKIDMTDAAKKAAHDSCNQDHGKSFSSCWGPEFENGSEE